MLIYGYGNAFPDSIRRFGKHYRKACSFLGVIQNPTSQLLSQTIHNRESERSGICRIEVVW